MRYLVNIIILVLFSFNVQASDPPSEWFYFDRASEQDSQDKNIFYANFKTFDIKPKELNNICHEFRGRHLEDIKLLEKYFSDLKISIYSADEVKKISNQIKIVVDRIIYNSKPEWNKPLINMTVSWGIPKEELFVAPEFAVENLEANKIFPGQELHFGELLDLKVNYMGLANDTYLDILANDPTCKQTEDIYCMADGGSYLRYLVVYWRKFSLFEICQLIQSLEVDIKLRVNDYLAGGDHGKIKTFKLRVKKGVDYDYK